VRSKIVIGGVVVQFFLVIVLTTKYGLIGFAEAQNVTYGFGSIVGYLVTVRFIRGSFGLWPPFSVSSATFAELWSFGLRLQAISIVSFLYEPLTKFVISSAGGVEVLGLYEIAQKFVVQVRQLAIGPVAVLMPAFAHVSDRAPDRLVLLFRRSLAAAIVVGLTLMGGAALCAPIVSILLLGHVDETFVIFASVLSAASFVNIAASPANTLAVSLGSLNWNLWGAAVTTVGSPLFALSIGKEFGPIGVVVAATLAFVAGNILSMIMNTRRAEMPSWSRPVDIANFVRNDLVNMLTVAARGKKL
jgi:O-antigen/teichoic acid export membrane protein